MKKIILLITISFFIVSCSAWFYLIPRNNSRQNNIKFNGDTFVIDNSDLKYSYKLGKAYTAPLMRERMSPEIRIYGDIISKDKILLRKDYFMIEDSLGNQVTASKLIVNITEVDSIILNNNEFVTIDIVFGKLEDGKMDIFLPPIKLSFNYKSETEDSIKPIIKEMIFDFIDKN